MNFILSVAEILFLISFIYLWRIIKKESIPYTSKQKKAFIWVNIFGIILLFPSFFAFGQGFIEGLTSNL